MRSPRFPSRVLAGVAAALLLLAAVIGARALAARPAWRQYPIAAARASGVPVPPGVVAITPVLTGQPELCTTCHIGIEEISPSHPVETFGCVVCHGGDRLALDADRAHASLRGGRNPSDLSVVHVSCGQAACHGGESGSATGHITRVMNSLQATYAGGIALARYTFGAQPDLSGRYGAIAARDDDPPPGFAAALDILPDSASSGHAIDTQFRQSCLEGGCHLSAPPAAKPYRLRGTGCSACHTPYADDGLYRGSDPTIDRSEPGHASAHTLTIAIAFTQCNHCHNRGTYSLRAMEFMPRPDLPPAAALLSDFLPVQTRRLAEYYQPIGLFTRCEWELDCIDCHTAEAAMGNGHIADSKADAQGTECRTCHGTLTALPQTATIDLPDEAAMRQARLNGHSTLAVGDRVVVNRLGEKLWSVRESSPGRFVETLKVGGEERLVPLVLGSECLQKPNEQESRFCHECHAYPRDAVLAGEATP